jgi:hypothetical protein
VINDKEDGTDCFPRNSDSDGVLIQVIRKEESDCKVPEQLALSVFGYLTIASGCKYYVCDVDVDPPPLSSSCTRSLYSWRAIKGHRPSLI